MVVVNSNTGQVWIGNNPASTTTIFSSSVSTPSLPSITYAPASPIVQSISGSLQTAVLPLSDAFIATDQTSGPLNNFDIPFSFTITLSTGVNRVQFFTNGQYTMSGIVGSSFALIMRIDGVQLSSLPGANGQGTQAFTMGNQNFSPVPGAWSFAAQLHNVAAGTHLIELLVEVLGATVNSVCDSGDYGGNACIFTVLVLPASA